MAQDGVRGAVKFNDDDRYCLDGQRLMLVSGTYGQPGAEYRTELDNFTKVISLGRAGAGPLTFKAWTKSGRILEFGNTADSAIEVVAAPGVTAPWQTGTVREWAVNKISDSSGNSMTVAYEEDAVNGVYRPSRIDYGANANTAATNHSYVTFTYAALTNPVPKFRAGAISKQVSRLTQIDTYSGTLAHQMKLTFINVTPTQVPRLSSVQLCDGALNCLPATNFTYATQNASFGSTLQWPVSGIIPLQRAVNTISDSTDYGTSSSPVQRTLTFTSVVDLNGDGLPDFYVTNYSLYWQKLYLNTGNGFSTTETAWPLPAGVAVQNDKVRSPFYTIDTVSQLVDLNGDGLPDMYVTKANYATPQKRSVVYLNSGTGFATTGTQWSLPSAIRTPNQSDADGVCQKSAIVDMDGDGLPDIFYTPNMTGVTPAVYRNTGSGFSDTATTWPLPSDASCSQQSVSWFDWDLGGVTRTQVTVALTDLNGDGLPDLYVTPASYTTLPARVYFNTGVGFMQTSTRWILQGSAKAQNESLNGKVTTQLIDLNGDGLPDLFYTIDQEFSYPTRSWVFFNTGSGFDSNYVQWPIPAGVASYVGAYSGFEAAGNGTVIGMPDLDGDGLPDLFFTVQRIPSDATAYLNQAVPPAQLVQISSATSPPVTITYSKLTNASVYTKDTGANAAVMPKVDLAGARTVVSSVAVDNGIGATNTTTYKYGGLKAEVGTGRGLLGFRWYSATDNITGVERYSEYRQDFPYTGLAAKTELRKSGAGNAGVLKRTENTVACQDQTVIGCTVAAGNRYFPYVTSTTENSWDLNGAAFFSKTTANTYGQNPQYGAPTQTTVTHGDGVTQSIANEYWPADTGNWIINRLKRSTVTSTKP